MPIVFLFFILISKSYALTCAQFPDVALVQCETGKCLPLEVWKLDARTRFDWSEFEFMCFHVLEKRILSSSEMEAISQLVNYKEIDLKSFIVEFYERDSVCTLRELSNYKSKNKGCLKEITEIIVQKGEERAEAKKMMLSKYKSLEIE